MKLIFNLLKIAICILLILGIFLLLINDTFINTNYKTKYMSSDGIPMERFIYKLDKSVDKNGSFVTLLSLDKLELKKKEYLDSLSMCYGKYYYDKENDITLIKYNIFNKGYYRSINISYDFDNYCGEKFVLGDMWIYDYNALSALDESNISEVNIIALIDKLHSAKRIIDPIIDDDYKAKEIVNIECSLKTGKYSLEIKDFSENEIVVIKTMNDKKQFAVYEVENARVFLGALK